MAAVMAIAMVPVALADGGTTASTVTGTITIDNAAIGETYYLYKLFNATYAVETNGDNSTTSTAYIGTIPSDTSTTVDNGGYDLTNYFEYLKDANNTVTNYIVLKSNLNGSLNKDAITELTNWAHSQPEPTDSKLVKKATSNTLVFDNLDFGYYVIVSTTGDGKAISVDTTNPNATIHDKNTTTPIDEPRKKVEDEDVYIGQTVTYTIEFGTANYNKINDNTYKKIVKYIIHNMWLILYVKN
jgi:hypothetical protein